jgi:lipopolysaccharide transport system permease protein
VLQGRFLDLMLYRAVAELKTEASRNYLGIVWWFLEPLLYLGVFYVVFALGFRRGGDGFVPFLLCGLVAWKWFDSTVRTSCNSITMNAGLIGQVYFPKFLLPASVVLTNTLKFGIILSIFILFLSVSGYPPGTAWSWLPAVVMVELLLTAAVALLAAALIPLLPDLSYVINYGMTMLFFMSGIFFDVEHMAPEVQGWMKLNPVVPIVTAYRSILLANEPPALTELLPVVVLSAVLLLVVWRIYARFDRLYPKVLGV